MRIALIGYGKMGHMIETLARKRGHEIVCIIDLNEENKFDSNEFKSAQVAIEFTTPGTAETNVRRAWKAGLPVVCGTTGWDAQSLMEQPNTPGLVWKSNFSVGVNITFELNRELAHIMANHQQYTPSLSETHHIHKLDKPSGTAKTLAEQLAAARGIDCDTIPVESIREGEVHGVHTIAWDSPEDTIIITHIAKGREGFALGAIIEAEKIAKK